jgi:S1/P1 Nuclease
MGHQAIAELVWRKLDAKQRQSVSDLLKQHPLYQQMLLADLPADVDSNEWAFLNAAVWPDRVRPAKPGQPFKPKSITQYDLYPHALGLPFLRSGDTNHALIDNFFIAKPDAAMVLSNCLATLRNTHASAPDRAVSLCWVVHLCGDLHQPLHAANLVTKDTPGGNSLGGAFVVREPGTEHVIDLHAYWDQLIGPNSDYKNLIALADKLAADPKLEPTNWKEYLEHKSVYSWVQESFKIAVNFSYAESRIQFVDSKSVKSGEIPISSVPVLKDDYIEEAHMIARHRAVLAAQRLTDELKEVWQ